MNKSILITSDLSFVGSGEVYSVEGSQYSNCSMLEAVATCEGIAESKIDYSYSKLNRIGDHIWGISSVSKFKAHYSKWSH